MKKRRSVRKEEIFGRKQDWKRRKEDLEERKEDSRKTRGKFRGPFILVSFRICLIFNNGHQDQLAGCRGPLELDQR